MSRAEGEVEPPTSGKVQLDTTHGSIVIELWAKECPLACRNFIQLCMEGYYDNCIFHRIIDKTLIQAGDPTGTGDGGESVYGKPFKHEIHNKLRFRLRGLLAMAEEDECGSQFFITLSPGLNYLDKKHCVFGKVIGNTIYNALAIGEVEVNEEGRPFNPPKIKGAQILVNPYEDIVPRKKVVQAPQQRTTAPAPKREAVRNKDLLSINEEDEGEDVFTIAKSRGVKSSHDVLNDPRLLKETEYTGKPNANKAGAKPDKKVGARGIARYGEEEDDDGEDYSAMEKRVTAGRPAKRAKMTDSEASIDAMSKSRMEYEEIKKQLKAKPTETKKDEPRGKSELAQRRERYLRNMNSNLTTQDEKDQMLKKLSSFSNLLVVKKQNVSEEPEEEKPREIEEVNTNTELGGTMGYKKFKSEPKPKAAEDVTVHDTASAVKSMEMLLDSDEVVKLDAVASHRLNCPTKAADDDYYITIDPLEASSGTSAADKKRVERLKLIRTQDHERTVKEKDISRQKLREGAKGRDYT